jgi:hypothetical protein
MTILTISINATMIWTIIATVGHVQTTLIPATNSFQKKKLIKELIRKWKNITIIYLPTKSIRIES